MAQKNKQYPHIGRKTHELDAAHWESCYQKGKTPWDHGEASPGLVDFLEQERYTPGKALVPGCGKGYECIQLARHGFAVTGVDVSKLAVKAAKQHARHESVTVRYVLGNCLHPHPAWRSAFDWAFEHTCFCAIDPALRDDYVRAIAAVLRRGGYLLGIFFNIQPQSGPPFGATREELLDRFRPYFRLVQESVPRSFPNRKGEELLMLWKKS